MVIAAVGMVVEGRRNGGTIGLGVGWCNLYSPPLLVRPLLSLASRRCLHARRRSSLRAALGPTVFGCGSDFGFRWHPGCLEPQPRPCPLLRSAAAAGRVRTHSWRQLSRRYRCRSHKRLRSPFSQARLAWVRYGCPSSLWPRYGYACSCSGPPRPAPMGRLSSLSLLVVPECPLRHMYTVLQVQYRCS